MKTIFWTAILISTLVVARARADGRVVCINEEAKTLTTISFVESGDKLTEIRGAYSAKPGCGDSWENVFVQTKQTTLVSQDAVTGDKTFNLSLEDGGFLPWTTFTIVIPAGDAKRFEATLTEDDVHENLVITSQISCSRE